MGRNLNEESTPLLAESSSSEYEKHEKESEPQESKDKDHVIKFKGIGGKTESIEYEIFTASGNHVLSKPEEISTGTT